MLAGGLHARSYSNIHLACGPLGLGEDCAGLGSIGLAFKELDIPFKYNFASKKEDAITTLSILSWRQSCFSMTSLNEITKKHQGVMCTALGGHANRGVPLVKKKVVTTLEAVCFSIVWIT